MNSIANSAYRRSDGYLGRCSGVLHMVLHILLHIVFGMWRKKLCAQSVAREKRFSLNGIDPAPHTAPHRSVVLRFTSSDSYPDQQSRGF